MQNTAQTLRFIYNSALLKTNCSQFADIMNLCQFMWKDQNLGTACKFISGKYIIMFCKIMQLMAK